MYFAKCVQCFCYMGGASNSYVAHMCTYILQLCPYKICIAVTCDVGCCIYLVMFDIYVPILELYTHIA